MGCRVRGVHRTPGSASSVNRDRSRGAVMLGQALFALAVLGGVLSTTSFAAEALPSRQNYRIGLLGGNPPNDDVTNALRSGMTDLGWDQRGTKFVERWANARPERLPGLAAELVAM